MSKSVLHIFSSKSFIVSGFMFRSLIHFEFIIVNGIKECSSLLFLFLYCLTVYGCVGSLSHMEFL